MSNQAFSDGRRRHGGASGFGSTGRRTALGYWLPLALTVGVATVSLAAWVWSERRDGDDEAEDEDDYYEGREPHQRRNGSAPVGPEPGANYGQAEGGYVRATGVHDGSQPEDASVISRVQGALRRTPSPQQLFDGASRKVAAGVAAAGAVVGGALTAIREEGANDFEDHSRWTEEANSRGVLATAGPPAMTGAFPPPVVAPAAHAPPTKYRKTVAIVVSSVGDADDQEHPEGQISEHSILSHLPEFVEPGTARVFVLIYAPGLQPHSANSPSSSRPTPSLSSSYANITPEEATAETSQDVSDLDVLEPRPTGDDFGSASPLFKALYNQAQALVDKETMILPFSTPSGHVHMLRHLSPDIVYIQESMTGNGGEAVNHITGWVRQVVVVVGAEGGRGGLVDSDDESALGTDKGEKWWQKEGVTGLGKRIDVVDGLRTGEDWRRRVSGHD
ncbi:hypothetical protein ACJ72_03999 [Emergomyces africanus]|uniref:Peroxin-22-like protein Pex22-like-Penicillium chrysogenum n=1 Tax=Emergomyces africanus TaxID=1955775 RepID=A0A1B7NY05_9EURO|nr:hypothetical protein ACJ72_03999 [Emergomyces africanus]